MTHIQLWLRFFGRGKNPGTLFSPCFHSNMSLDVHSRQFGITGFDTKTLLEKEFEKLCRYDQDISICSNNNNDDTYMLHVLNIHQHLHCTIKHPVLWVKPATTMEHIIIYLFPPTSNIYSVYIYSIYYDIYNTIYVYRMMVVELLTTIGLLSSYIYIMYIHHLHYLYYLRNLYSL